MPINTCPGVAPALAIGFKAQASYPMKWVYGVTRNTAGAAVGSATVKIFGTLDDILVWQTTSDASGRYSAQVPDGRQYYVVAYKAGSPDVMGTTVNTLTGV